MTVLGFLFILYLFIEKVYCVVRNYFVSSLKVSAALNYSMPHFEVRGKNKKINFNILFKEDSMHTLKLFRKLQLELSDFSSYFMDFTVLLFI